MENGGRARELASNELDGGMGRDDALRVGPTDLVREVVDLPLEGREWLGCLWVEVRLAGGQGGREEDGGRVPGGERERA